LLGKERERERERMIGSEWVKEDGGWKEKKREMKKIEKRGDRELNRATKTRDDKEIDEVQERQGQKCKKQREKRKF